MLKQVQHDIMEVPMDDRDLFEKYYLKAIYFLKFRPRSVKEVRDALQKKRASDDMIDRIIKTLEEQKFLNDHDFVKWWIESRAKFRPKGERVVAMELRQKGIAKELIDEVLGEARSEDVPDQTAQLRGLVEQRFPKYKDLPRQEIYQKLGAYLSRRGFNWEEIKRAIDDILEKEYN